MHSHLLHSKGTSLFCMWLSSWMVPQCHTAPNCIFMMCLHTEFDIPSSIGSLVITVKLKDIVQIPYCFTFYKNNILKVAHFSKICWNKNFRITSYLTSCGSCHSGINDVRLLNSTEVACCSYSFMKSQQFIKKLLMWDRRTQSSLTVVTSP